MGERAYSQYFESALHSIVAHFGDKVGEVWNGLVETVLWFAKSQALDMGILRDDHPVLWFTYDFIEYASQTLRLSLPRSYFGCRLLDYEPKMEVPNELLFLSAHPLVLVSRIQSI